MSLMLHDTPALDTADMFNHRFESRLREAGGKKAGFERLFQLVVLQNLTFAKLTHPEARFIRAHFPTKLKTLEEKIVNMWREVYAAVDALVKKDHAASAKEIDVAITCIRHAKRITGRALLALKKTDTMTQKNFKVHLKNLGRWKTQLLDLKAANALGPYDRVIHSILNGFTKKNVASRLTAYLAEFEKVEIEVGKGVMGTLKDLLGFNTDTVYGNSYKGTLGRGVYVQVFTALSDFAKKLQREPSTSEWAKIAPQLSLKLVEAVYISRSLNKESTTETRQAKRAVTLMKLNEFIGKAKLFAAASKEKVDLARANKALGPLSFSAYSRVYKTMLDKRFWNITMELEVALPKIVDWKGLPFHALNPVNSESYAKLVAEVRNDIAELQAVQKQQNYNVIKR